MRLKTSLISYLLPLAGMSMFPTQGYCSSISVSPVAIEVTAEADAATSITVTNRSAQAVDIQARVMRWTQQDGEDSLAPEGDVAVSPPITSVQPGQQQIVRVIRVSKTQIEGEEAYRLLVDELPSGMRRSVGNVDLVIRQVLPVFFQNPAAARQPLSFAIKRGHGTLRLQVSNPGNVHYRISNLVVSSPGNRTILNRPGLAGYVLAGSSFSWPLPPNAIGSVRVSAQSNFGSITSNADLH